MATDNQISLNQAANGLLVWVGAPVAVHTIPAGIPLLLLEADLGKAQQQKKLLKDMFNIMVCAEVLSAQANLEIQWHQFNDDRFDGAISEANWHKSWANLRQISQQARIGRSLENILDVWVAHTGATHKPALQLVVRQGDPLAALQGLGPWCSQLENLQLSGICGQGPWMEALKSWLQERGFISAPFGGGWQRDPIASQLVELQEKDQRIADLEEQLSSLAVRLLLANNGNSKATL